MNLNLRQNVGSAIESVCKNTGLSEEEVKKMTFEELLELRETIVTKLRAENTITEKVKELKRKKSGAPLAIDLMV
jgi:hypothetical protein